MTSGIHGVVPPIVTPFNSTHQIDKDRLRDLTSYLLDAGVQGIVACGSTGEFPLMSLEERKMVTEIVAEAVNGKVPVIEGVTAVRTEDAVTLARHAKDLHLDAILAAPSYYYKLDEKELRGYYADLAKVDLPIIIYDFLTHEVKGWISTVSNVIPKQCVDLVRLVVERNELEKARKLFYSLLPTIKLIDGPKF